jgi:hypothetical protein
MCAPINRNFPLKTAIWKLLSFKEIRAVAFLFDFEFDLLSGRVFPPWLPTDPWLTLLYPAEPLTASLQQPQ